MIARPFRFGLLLLVPLAMAIRGASSLTFAASSVPIGIDLGGSGPVIAPLQATPPAPSHAPVAAPQHGTQMVHDGRDDAHSTGTVNSVDAAGHKVNLTHQPIPEIGWPSMTMDFAVAPSVNLAGIKPGMRVIFTIQRGAGGLYEIQAITPAGGGR